jgi:hypothetical protein
MCHGPLGTTHHPNMASGWRYAPTWVSCRPVRLFLDGRERGRGWKHMHDNLVCLFRLVQDRIRVSFPDWAAERNPFCNQDAIFLVSSFSPLLRFPGFENASGSLTAVQRKPRKVYRRPFPLFPLDISLQFWKQTFRNLPRATCASPRPHSFSPLLVSPCSSPRAPKQEYPGVLPRAFSRVVPHALFPRHESRIELRGKNAGCYLLP